MTSPRDQAKQDATKNVPMKPPTFFKNDVSRKTYETTYNQTKKK